MGVVWFVFHILQFLLIRFTQQNLRCMSKSAMEHLQTPDWKSNLPKFSSGDGKCMFVDFFNKIHEMCSLSSVE